MGDKDGWGLFEIIEMRCVTGRLTPNPNPNPKPHARDPYSHILWVLGWAQAQGGAPRVSLCLGPWAQGTGRER